MPTGFPTGWGNLRGSTGPGTFPLRGTDGSVDSGRWRRTSVVCTRKGRSVTRSHPTPVCEGPVEPRDVPPRVSGRRPPPSLRKDRRALGWRSVCLTPRFENPPAPSPIPSTPHTPEQVPVDTRLDYGWAEPVPPTPGGPLRVAVSTVPTTRPSLGDGHVPVESRDPSPVPPFPSPTTPSE